MELETGQRESNAVPAPYPSEEHNVYFHLRLEQKVKLADIKLPARIVGRGERRNGHVYLVVWWAENKRYEAWLYEHELEG